VVGGRVFGGSDRYVQDLDTNKAFVITGTMVSLLEGGEPSLRPIDLRPFEPKDAVSVELAAKDQKKRVQRIKVKPSTPEGDDPHAPPPNADALVETWGEGATRRHRGRQLPRQAREAAADQLRSEARRREPGAGGVGDLPRRQGQGPGHREALASRDAGARRR
jgi:hypothetical protein